MKTFMTTTLAVVTLTLTASAEAQTRSFFAGYTPTYTNGTSNAACYGDACLSGQSNPQALTPSNGTYFTGRSHYRGGVGSLNSESWHRPADLRNSTGRRLPLFNTLPAQDAGYSTMYPSTAPSSVSPPPCYNGVCPPASNQGYYGNSDNRPAGNGSYPGAYDSY